MHYYIKKDPRGFGYWDIYRWRWWFPFKIWWTSTNSKEDAIRIIEADKNLGEWI